MKNFRFKVLAFIIITSLILFSTSYFSKNIIEIYPNFKSINILSVIISNTPKKIKNPNKKYKKENKVKSECTIYNDFEQYNNTNRIIGFNPKDEVVLDKFQNKLLALSQNKKVKIRIAWFGDSVIEGDLVTQQLRELFYNYFKSNSGVGFLPINTVSSKFRITGTINSFGSYETNNFKKNPNDLYLSGYSYNSSAIEFTVKDRVKKNPLQNLEKWLYCGKGDSLEIELNKKIRMFNTSKKLNKILLDNSPSNEINFKINRNSAPIFGVSMEPETGVIIDNFSFRGITGVELRKVRDELLDDINTTESYDLIVLQYGVNLLFKPNLKNFDYYYSLMNPVIKKLRNHLYNSEFLIIGSADRAFKYNGEWKTAIGIDSLIKVQAKLAFDNKIPFFNLYKSMGGEGSIVKWADTIPRLANKDYIHFNYKGATQVANIIFNSLIKDYKKISKSKTRKIIIKK
jgi:lysophospholipase L1-like esterase